MKYALAAMDIKEQFGVGFFIVLGLILSLVTFLMFIFGIMALRRGEIFITKYRKITGARARLLTFLYIATGVVFFSTFFYLENERMSFILDWIYIGGISASVLLTVSFCFMAKKVDNQSKLA